MTSSAALIAQVEEALERARLARRARGERPSYGLDENSFWRQKPEAEGAALAALRELRDRIERLEAVCDRLMEAGVEAWHQSTINDVPLHEWLGLTRKEYSAWVEHDVTALAVGAVSNPDNPPPDRQS